MKSGIHLQKKLRQVVTKDGAILTYRLVYFPKDKTSALRGLSVGDNPPAKSKVNQTSVLKK